MASAEAWRSLTAKSNSAKVKSAASKYKATPVRNRPSPPSAKRTVSNTRQKAQNYSSPTRRPAVSSNPSGRYSAVSGGGYGGGGEAFALGDMGMAPAPPMDENAFLGGDTTFLAQQAALQKALTDYQAQNQTQLSQYNTDYDVRNKELGQARVQGMDQQQNDFASRGLLNSGIYAGSQGELSRQFDDRGADMLRGKNDYTTNLASEMANFTTEQGLTLERARQEALARMSAGFAL